MGIVFFYVIVLYEDFTSKGNNISYENYRQNFAAENIGFGENRTDDCEVCLKFEHHKHEMNQGHDTENCDICQASTIHQQKAKVARHKYREEMSQENAYAVDMQKVILIPKLTTKESVFVSRLVCFNETFACGIEGDKSYAIMWHEGISGRKAADVTSAYCKFLVESGQKNPIFWTDNCAGQNKNWVFYSALAQIVNSPWGPDSISVKYLESGHTFMAADNIHGTIGKKMRQMNEIIDFRELTQVVSSAKNIEVVQMQLPDFYEFTAANKARTARNITLPILADIREVHFVRESRLMYYKVSHDSTEYEGVDFLRAKFNVEQFPKSHNRPRGITGKKKEGIIKLLTHVDGLKRKFYNDLAINEKAKDLVHSTDA